MAQSTQFDPAEITRAASDVCNVRRVFGEAYEHEGTTVIPVAKVLGALGTGSGTGEMGSSSEETTRPGSSGSGGGGGYGIRVRPLGVYVIDADGVHWRPALDLNRVILGGQLVGAVAVATFSLAWALRRRR
jgi:uncharacterized spore protein YtfJ